MYVNYTLSFLKKEIAEMKEKFFKFISVGKEMQVVLHIQNKNDFFSLLYILKSQGHRSLVGGCLWGRTESDMTEVT